MSLDAKQKIYVVSIGYPEDWFEKYAGMGHCTRTSLKARGRNRKLKQLFANVSLEN